MGKIKKPDDDMLNYININYSYDPNTGKIYKENKEVGFLHQSNYHVYYKIQVKGRKIKRSHMAWFLYYEEWPVLEIDHDNRDSLDDSIMNLSQVDTARQQQNKDSYTGYRGFSINYQPEEFRVRYKKFRVRNQKRGINLGYYSSRTEAEKAIDEYWKSRGIVGSEWDFDKI